MNSGKILIVDDDVDILHSATMFLKQKFEKVVIESKPVNISALLEEDDFDVILLDMNFTKGENEGEEGFYWLEQIKLKDPEAVVVLITAYSDVDLAVRAIKHGAVDFISKPWKNDKLLTTISSALQLRSSKLEVRKLRTANDLLTREYEVTLGEMVGLSPAIQGVYDLIEKVAGTDANVLILGENGTGKELVARALHKKSLRKDGPFVSVDLGALSESLFESELFGHVKGAFTDAREDKTGRFEAAAGGTVFLDEIGNLSLPLQVKLLSVLQKRMVTRVGSNKEKPIDVRFISATNMPLLQMIEENKFRRDLLYRINTVEIEVPPLRNRVEDIHVLIEHFKNIYSVKYKKSGLKIEKSVVEKLKKYSWPGNVRELQHSVEKAVILADGGVIDSTENFLGNKKAIRSNEQVLSLDEAEKKYIQEIIQRNGGNIAKTARDLGLTRTAMYRRLNKHGI